MRVHQLVCPNCKASMSSKAGIEAGSSVACPKCKSKFKAVAPKKNEDEVVEDFEVIEDFEVVDDEAPKKKPATGAKAGRKQQDDDDDEGPPAKAKSKSRDQSDDKPRSKRRSQDEDDDDDDDSPRSKRSKEHDDDDDRPRKKRRRDEELESAYGKLKKNIWVRASVMVVLLGILGVGGFFLYKKIEKDRATERENEEIRNRNSEEDFVKPIRPDDKGPQEKKRPLINDPRLVGRWKSASDVLNGGTLQLEYRANGTFVEIFSRGGAEEKTEGRWRALREGPAPNSVIVEQASVGTTERLVRIVGTNSLLHDFTDNGKSITVTLSRQK